jgi:protein phosphatase
MKVKGAGATDRGKKRPLNEDYYFFDESLGLFIVADGMGGHLGGQEASRMAVEEVVNQFSSVKEIPHPPVKFIKEVFYSANKKVWERGNSDPSLKGMGTTLTMLFIKGESIWIGHVGDSRAYLYSENKLNLLTSDHSWLEEQIKAGMISDERTRRFMKNVITRSVGFKKEVEVDVYRYDIKAGDLFLLCTDGLNIVLTDEEIKKEIESTDIEELPKKLIDLANSRGGPDNITVVMGKVLEI